MMRHAMSKSAAGFTIAVALSLTAAVADPSDPYITVEHPGAADDLSVQGFATDYQLSADPSVPPIPTGQDVEIRELQDAFPSTNWPPSMRK
jgi:hypothetical protein